jgi:hypothetical protein
MTSTDHQTKKDNFHPQHIFHPLFSFHITITIIIITSQNSHTTHRTSLFSIIYSALFIAVVINSIITHARIIHFHIMSQRAPCVVLASFSHYLPFYGTCFIILLGLDGVLLLLFSRDGLMGIWNLLKVNRVDEVGHGKRSRDQMISMLANEDLSLVSRN